MADVDLSLAELEEMSAQLQLIIDEFAEAVGRSEALEEAIGAPFRRTELRDAVEDFETRWDVQRDDLQGDVTAVRDHLDDVIDGFQGLDSDSAIRISENQCTTIA